MLLNPRTRRTLDKIEQELTEEVTRAVCDVARFRSLDADVARIAHDFLAFLDGLWLRCCLSDGRDTGRERVASVRLLGTTLGPVERVQEAVQLSPSCPTLSLTLNHIQQSGFF